MRKTHLLAAVAVLAIVLIFAAAAGAETRDGVLEKVRAMLAAEVSEPIILKWLAGSGERPRHPNAEELIGLKRAGASDELLAKLLDLAAQTPPAEPDPVAAAPAEPEPVAAPRAAAEVSPAPAGAAPGPAAVAAPAAGEIAVDFELLYRPDFDEGDEEWGLYVYLDGEPLTFVPAATLMSPEPLRLRRLLPPGRHLLRVAQERHRKYRRDRWVHSARVADIELPLPLAVGASAAVELTFRQSHVGRAAEGPLSFRYAQGGNVRTVERKGGDPEGWPLVCEEIEANAAPGEELKKSLRRQLEDCRRWSELWPGLEVPSRDQVRETLARSGYRPIAEGRPVD